MSKRTAKKSNTQTRERPTPVPIPPADDRDESPLSLLVWGLIVFLAALVCYFPACRFGYITWDDTINIIENPHLNALGGPDFGYYWGHDFLLVYRPLIYDIWSLIARFSRVPTPYMDPAVGLVNFNPNGFHTATVLMQAVDAVLVYLLLRLLVKRNWAAAAGALLFSLHPMQDEAVGWITGGNVVFFGFFAFLGLYQYLLYSRLSQDGVAPVARRVHYGSALFWYVCATLTYPLAVTLPVVAWALDCWVVRRPVKDVTVSLVPWIIFSLSWVFVTANAKHLENALVHVSTAQKFVVAGDAIAFYLGKLLVPVGLTVDYGRTPDYVTGHAWGYATAGIALAFPVALWFGYRRRPVFSACGFVFIAGLLPTLGFVTNPFQLYSTVADRYIYLSMLGPALALAWWLGQLRLSSTRGWIAYGVTFVGVVLLAVAASRQVQHFRSDETLFPYALKMNPRSWAIAMNYAVYLQRERRTDDAVGQYERTISIVPNFPDAHVQLAGLLADEGNHVGAAEHLSHAVEYTNPPSASLFTKLGQQQMSSRDYAHGIESFQEALSLKPGDADAEEGLGIALGQTGKRPEAIEYLRAALRGNPRDTKALDNLGVFLAQENKLDEAVTAWRSAIAVDGHYERALLNLATGLSMQGKRAESIAEYQAALQIDPNDARARVALNMLLQSPQRLVISKREGVR